MDFAAMRSLALSPKILSGDRGGDHLGVMGKALPLPAAALQTVETNKMVIKSTFLSACPILHPPHKSSALLSSGGKLLIRISNCCNVSDSVLDVHH